MKNLIIRRITILMSISLFISTILVASLGVFFSEGLIADTRGKEFIPDLSVLSQLTVDYQNGNIDKEVFENILMNSTGENTRKYMILARDESVLFTTEEGMDPEVEKKIYESFEQVVNGQEVYHQFNLSVKKTVILVGVPMIKDGKNNGGIFLLVDMMDVIARRKRFFGALIASMLIVLPFVVVLSYLVLQRIINPIKNVLTVGLSVIKGDYSIRADETLKGEIGLIGKTINKLSTEFYMNASRLYVEKNRLYQVLNSLEEGMIAVDKNRIVTHYNKVVLDMFALDEVQMKDKCIDDIEDLNVELHEVTQAIEGKYPLIKNGIHKDTIMRIIIAPIENEKEESVGAVVLFRDVTELEKLETMRRDYVANVSHELRSPLTSIRGLIEPLMDSIVTDENDVKRYHRIIYQESLRLSRLVDDIMELSRLQTNDAAISKTSVDLSSIIDMVFERYKLFDEEIDLIYKPITLPKAFTNYDRIEQILVILLDNAYKFTPKGGQVEIITQVRDQDILLTVKDTGTGIAQEDIPFVFDRFYKGDKSRSKKGTGLGLSIAKEILKIMGESIEVKSQLGQGSAFEFTVEIEKH